MIITEEQSKIVYATEPQIAVIGPPGTGKTRVLTERIKHLIESGVNPERMVAITFTNFAANEMMSRVPKSGPMFIGTMHSYAAQILMRNNVPIDLTHIIEKKKFDELIKKVNSTPNLDIPVIQYLFVDEVQDLCDYEFEFIKKLPCENIFLGGDADQCIYQFKGARPEFFNSYCRSPNTKLYTLTRNFRCGHNIVEFGEYFLKGIPNRIQIDVVGNLNERGWITRTDFDDALYSLYISRNYGNWFILTRTNIELEEVSKKLKQNNIPFTSFKQGDFTNEEIEQFLKNDDVKVLTIHSAKGLEMDNVIVVGCRNWAGVEEKYIEYVAATRARKRLFWCPPIIPKGKRGGIDYKTAHQAVGITWE